MSSDSSTTAPIAIEANAQPDETPRVPANEIQLLARLIVSLVHRLAPIFAHREDTLTLYRMIVRYWSKPEHAAQSNLVKQRAHDLVSQNGKELFRYALAKYDDGTLRRFGFDKERKLEAPLLLIRSMGLF